VKRLKFALISLKETRFTRGPADMCVNIRR